MRYLIIEALKKRKRGRERRVFFFQFQRQCRRCLLSFFFLARRFRPRLKKTTSTKKKLSSGEVVSPLARLNQADPTKKGGRWAPEFVWNTDWAGALDAVEEAKKKKKEREEEEERRKRGASAAVASSSSSSSAAAAPSTSGGGLSLARSLDLDRMDIDLTEYLVPKKKKETSAASSTSTTSTSSSSSRSSSSSAFTPSQKSFQADERRWTRGGKFSRKSASLQSQPAAAAEEIAKRAEEEAQSYESLKQELVLWAAVAGLGGSAAALAFYGGEAAASYAVGAVFGTIYLRLLGRSVDSFGGGSGGVGGAVGGAVGQQRLLLPLILALGYNRYEFLLAARTGHHAQLLAMLLGFFTYKAAVVGKQAATLLGELSGSVRDGSGNTRFGSDDGVDE